MKLKIRKRKFVFVKGVILPEIKGLFGRRILKPNLKTFLRIYLYVLMKSIINKIESALIVKNVSRKTKNSIKLKRTSYRNEEILKTFDKNESHLIINTKFSNCYTKSCMKYIHS